MDSFRKAYGALKDSTKVGLAKVNSEFKDLDIAIVKATNHAECAPKERHVRKIFAAVSLASPRADVGYCIHALSKRLSKTRSWIVAIKSLIVFHRILRECDNSFREELMHISRRGHTFHISNFKDDSSALAWECSAWVRSYAVFLEERLECFRSLNFEIDSSDRVSVSKETESKSRALNVEQLLEQLPALQQLLYRLVCCQPEGAARYNHLVQYALALIVKESFKVYCTINDGIIMLVDTYFDMPKPKAVAALNIYKKAGRQADHLADFYDFCRTLDLARTFQFPILRQPPSSFLETMEDYIKEAPDRVLTEHQNKKGEARKTEETTGKRVKEAANKAIVAQEKPVSEPKQPPQPIVDLLDLSEPSPKAEQPEDTNPLALAICQPSAESDQPQPQTSHGSGWELALVTAPSTTNSPQTTQSKVGAFDKFMLDSLYEDGVQRQLEIQRAGYITDGPSYGYGYLYGNGNGSALGPLTPLVQEPSLPFGMAMAPTDPRMMMMMMYPQQQMAMQQQQQRYEMMMQQQMMMMAPINHNLYASQYQQYQHQKQHEPHHMVSNNLIPYASQYEQEQHQHQYEQHQHQQPPLPPQQMVSINPFGDPYSYPQSSMPPHGNHTLY